MSAVELRGVSFSYDGKTDILKNINFSAEYGEVTLISGHSGDGKSTLMSVISGIIPNVTAGKLSGEVVVGGEDISGKKLGYVCRKVGVVLQNADEQIIQKLVGDEIAFGCENLAFPAGIIEKQIDIVCGLLGLDSGSRTRSLSGGQKQRLITASTLAMGQKIIILDEPLANLDKAGAHRLMSALRVLAGAGYCIMVIEHRLDMVLPYVDCVWHMSAGGIVAVSDKKAYLEEQTKVISDICPTFSGSDAALRLDNVAYSVKKRRILEGVTCDIPRGSRVVLLGENGCGKTTLMRLIARLCKPDGGSITQFVDAKLGQKRGSRKWYKRVGVVYQNPDYQLFMPTVRKELEFGAKSKEYAASILETFSLAHLAERHPQSLSEGQKRRVSIAAVAACRPEIMLLDEPTVGQDYDGLCELVDILNRLHSETGNTMITVTHDMRCVEALCDIAYILKDGKIAASGGKELARGYFK